MSKPAHSPETPTKEAKEQVLQERARRLAQPIPSSENSQESTTLMVLQVGRENYGVELAYVLGIYQVSRVTPVPGAAPFWAGVCQWHGRIYPVLDLHHYLSGSAMPERNHSDKIALVAAADLEVGLLADEISGIRSIPLSAVNPPLLTVPDVRRETITGVTNDLTTLLDIEALLTSPKLLHSSVGQRGLNSGRDFRSAPPAVADLLNTSSAGRQR